MITLLHLLYGVNAPFNIAIRSNAQSTNIPTFDPTINIIGTASNGTSMSMTIHTSEDHDLSSDDSFTLDMCYLVIGRWK